MPSARIRLTSRPVTGRVGRQLVTRVGPYQVLTGSGTRYLCSGNGATRSTSNLDFESGSRSGGKSCTVTAPKACVATSTGSAAVMSAMAQTVASTVPQDCEFGVLANQQINYPKARSSNGGPTKQSPIRRPFASLSVTLSTSVCNLGM
jgi:hypothetical protein